MPQTPAKLPGKSSLGRKIQILINAAERGAGEAAQELGERYREGRNVKADLSASLHWYSVGAKLGDADAQNNYGTMLLNGLGCEPDAEAAAKWYRASAEQGQPVAQFNLAMRYFHGSGIEQDDAQAVHWLELAAAQGYADAIGQLGTMYRFGRGVERDLLHAADLHLQAAQGGDVVAHGNLCDYQDELVDLALAGSRRAAFALCHMFDWGLGTEKDQTRCWAWLRWAHDGCPPANRSEVDDEVSSAFRFFCAGQDPEIRAEGERWLSGLLADKNIVPGEIKTIVHVGAAGGDIQLRGTWTREGWRFYRELNEWAPELIDQSHIHGTSETVSTWRGALRLLGRYPWHRLVPIEVHPEFAGRLWQAWRRRCEKEPEAGKRYEERWAKICEAD